MSATTGQVHRILLTGANGFVGSHILSTLLSAGHSIRAVIRSADKAANIARDFPSIPENKLDYAIVPDITVPGAFNTAVQSNPSFDTIIHTASPYLYKIVTSNREFLDPAIKGTTEMLHAVYNYAPSVKRVIITSSCASVVNFGDVEDHKPEKGKVYHEEDWNPITWEQAMKGDKGMAYRASKKFAEEAGWNFIRTTTPPPTFDLITLMPPMVYGPIRHTVHSVKDLNESNARIYNLFFTSSPDAELPPNGMHVYVDVRDLALAHMYAVTAPIEAGDQRYVICGGTVTSQNISDILRSSIPELQSRVPKGIPGGNILSDDAYRVDSGKAQRILGVKFRSREDTFRELGAQLVEIEKRSSVE